MNLLQVIIISILQGISELFPVSSLGHAVLVPKLLHWNINQKSETWLAFLVALHLGTASALLLYFREDWINVARAFVRSVRTGQMSAGADERLAWMVVLGTVPAGFVGFLFQHPLRSLFASPYTAAGFLIVNAAIMYAGERLLQRQVADASERRRAQGGGSRPAGIATGDSSAVLNRNGERVRYRDITELSWRDAAIVGFAQVGALFPGISRSGITMVAGLAAGLTHEASARYTFLLATPIIGAAGALELPTLFAGGARSILMDAILGMVLAGIAAYLSVRYLMRYFETGRLTPFALYCAGAGVTSIVLLAIGA